ncbi:MAG: substrate-binding domain-containing protein [Rhizobiaceae bacterium]
MHLVSLLSGTVALSFVTLFVPANAQERFLTVQSTTSTQNSGLYDYLLPIYERKAGIDVRVVAVGTGQAIKNAQNCDGDVLLVHAKAAEEKFVAEGYGTKRDDLMYNDFVVVGPQSDPAGISGSGDVEGALARIAETKSAFVSRGDDSGTHKAELKLWQSAGVDPSGASGEWYRESGSGMGATLNIAAGMEAYALTDRASWISFQNKAALQIAVEGDRELFNQYGVTLVNPLKCPSVRKDDGQAFIDWLVSDEGQAAIAGFKVNGEQLFFPNAHAE